MICPTLTKPGDTREEAARIVELETKVIGRLSKISQSPRARAFSWLKEHNSAFTFKTLLRHYAGQALTHCK